MKLFAPRPNIGWSRIICREISMSGTRPDAAPWSSPSNRPAIRPDNGISTTTTAIVTVTRARRDSRRRLEPREPNANTNMATTKAIHPPRESVSPRASSPSTQPARARRRSPFGTELMKIAIASGTMNA